MILVYFIYGLAFFTLGVAILLYPKKKSSFALAKDLNLIALFGIIHGLSEWVELYALVTPDADFLWLHILDGALLPVSYFCLLLFGVKVLQGPTGRMPPLRLLPAGLLLTYFVLMIFFRDVCPTRDVWERYLLGFPGIVLAGMALQGQVRQFAKLRLAAVLMNFRIAAVSFYAYAGLSLFSNCRSELFPFSFLNKQVFLEATGIPVQLLRTICALAITYSLIRMLEIFDWETRETLRRAQSDLEQKVSERTEELMKSKVALQERVDEHGETMRDLRQSTDALVTKQKQLQRLASELSLTETKERRRIASLLHDQVGRDLAAAKERADSLVGTITEAEHDPILRKLTASLDRCIEVTRGLVEDLCPPLLEEQGLTAALKWLAGQFQQEFDIECRVRDEEQDLPLPLNLSHLLFRFTRELLLNVVLHAEAGRAEIIIFLDKVNREVTIRVVDDGKGMEPSRQRCFEKKECGFGLFNIREKLNYLDGDFGVESQPGEGTTVTMTVPY